MRNVRRRLYALERLPKHPAQPGALERIKSLALQRLSQEHLELLPVGEFRNRELSAGETAAWLAWEDALDAEARRMGLKSFDEAERTFDRRS